MFANALNSLKPARLWIKVGASIKYQHRFLCCSKKQFSYPEPYTVGHPVNIKEQSVLLPGPERIRASKLAEDSHKFTTIIPNAKIDTIYDVLQHGLKISNDGDCAGTKSLNSSEYEWIKYSEALKRSQYVGSALVHMGLKPCNETFVGIFASNRIEFFLTLYGCAAYSMVLVPLYDTLGIDNVHHILEQVGFSLIIANSNKNALNALKTVKKLPAWQTLILMDSPSSEVVSLAKESNISVLHFPEFEAKGKDNKIDVILPKPGDLFCIPYTSGTTGLAKGVMLTHQNVLACLSSLVFAYGPAGKFGGTIISYLPPAHIYEIMNLIASLYFGRRIAFYRDDIRKLFDEIRSLKPTILPLVPRLMNIIYARAVENAKSKPWKWNMLKFVLSRKEKSIKKGIISKNTIYDKLFFKKFQAALGGNVHLIITTSAPLDREVMKFFKCASGCYILEAYGQTEVLGSTMTLPNDDDGGYVGPPLPCNHIKLVDVPDSNYFAKDDVGEICFKGANVFQGYFYNTEATNASIDSEGWHHSGDIGKWLPNGCLQIIDRKKHLFKLSQGEYIAPEKIENAYMHAPVVFQVFVDGFSDKDYTVAVIVPEPTLFPMWLKQNKFKTDDKEILKEKDLKKKLLQELHKWGKIADLNSLEQVKNLYIEAEEPFSLENDILTPTFKVKRNVARDRYKSVFQKLYEEGSLLKSQ